MVPLCSEHASQLRTFTSSARAGFALVHISANIKTDCPDHLCLRTLPFHAQGAAVFDGKTCSCCCVCRSSAGCQWCHNHNAPHQCAARSRRAQGTCSHMQRGRRRLCHCNRACQLRYCPAVRSAGGTPESCLMSCIILLAECTLPRLFVRLEVVPLHG